MWPKKAKIIPKYDQKTKNSIKYTHNWIFERWFLKCHYSFKFFIYGDEELEKGKNRKLSNFKVNINVDVNVKVKVLTIR